MAIISTNKCLICYASYLFFILMNLFNSFIMYHAYLKLYIKKICIWKDCCKLFPVAKIHFSIRKMVVLEFSGYPKLDNEIMTGILCYYSYFCWGTPIIVSKLWCTSKVCIIRLCWHVTQCPVLGIMYDTK